MRLAIISDIHANLPALEAVLEDAHSARPDQLWCLGDVVGYGAQPDECASLVAERCDLCLVGNHDLVVTGALSVDDFNDDARDAALWTREVLSVEHRDWLASLQPAAVRQSVALFHGSARDPVWEYVLTEESAQATFEISSASLVLVGHSHVALALTLDDDFVAGGLAPAETEVQLEGRWLLNPGSVGQPRDGDPRAAWLLLDLERRFAFFRRVEYPVEKTQSELRERGLPPSLAARLARGE